MERLTEQDGGIVTLYICIRNVSGSTLVRVTDSGREGLYFPVSPRRNSTLMYLLPNPYLLAINFHPPVSFGAL